MFGFLFRINNSKILFRDKFFKIWKWLLNNDLNAEKIMNKICTNMGFLVPTDKIKQPMISREKKINYKKHKK
jgi:hypothetical protein